MIKQFPAYDRRVFSSPFLRVSTDSSLVTHHGFSQTRQTMLLYNVFNTVDHSKTISNNLVERQGTTVRVECQKMLPEQVSIGNSLETKLRTMPFLFIDVITKF